MNRRTLLSGLIGCATLGKLAAQRSSGHARTEGSGMTSDRGALRPGGRQQALCVWARPTPGPENGAREGARRHTTSLCHNTGML